MAAESITTQEGHQSHRRGWGHGMVMASLAHPLASPLAGVASRDLLKIIYTKSEATEFTRYGCSDL
jgi:hypothetical protein